MSVCPVCGWVCDAVVMPQHPCGRRSHGVPGTYCAGCRCRPCLDAQVRYQKRWRYDVANGRRRTTTDVAAVADHIRHLQSLGWTLSGIASHADVSKTQVHDIVGRYQGRALRVGIASRITAVHQAHPGRKWNGRMLPDDDETFIPRVGAVRRIEAMRVAGWRYRDMLQLGGVDTSNVALHGGDLITWSTHVRVARLYDRIGMQCGPSRKAASIARNAGLLPALAWDDETIDDPEHQPDSSVLWRPSRRGNTAEDIHELLRMGETHAAIAARLGISEAAVDRHRYARGQAASA